MQRTSIRPGTVLFCGLALFSMFFGAGNLIFPPFLGAQAGVHTWPPPCGRNTTSAPPPWPCAASTP